MINKIVTFGEVLLRLTPPNYLKFSQAKEFVATYGGSEANVAVSLAQFGLNSKFVTRLPQNDIADACIKELRSHNVSTDCIARGGDRVGIYFLENGAVARQSKVVYDRAGSSFCTLQPGMIDWKEVLKDAQWFHWSGVAAAVSQGAADACMEGIKVADSMGLTISCDLNYRKNLWNYGKTPDDVMLPMVQYSDVIFGSEPEYEKVLGISKVGFKAISVNEQLNEDGFRAVGEQVVAKVPRCKKMFLELRNSINANHNTIAGVVYSDNTLA